MESSGHTLEFLEARLVALEKEVLSLRDRLARAGDARPTLRQQGTCACCGGRRVFYTPDVLDRGDGNVAQPLAIATTGFWRTKPRGALELYACVTCGFVEWYVKDTSELEELHQQDERYLLVEGGTGGSGPYR